MPISAAVAASALWLFQKIQKLTGLNKDQIDSSCVRAGSEIPLAQTVGYQK